MKNRILGMAARAAALVGAAASALVEQKPKTDSIPFEIDANDYEPLRQKRGKGRGRRPHGRGKFKRRTRGNLGRKRGPTPKKSFR